MTIEDRLAVQDVVTRYALALDRRDMAEVIGLFTGDACFDVPGFARGVVGADAIEAFLGALLNPLDVVQHINTNNLVTVTGDEASHTGYVLAQHVRDGDRFLIAGRYDDRLRRTAVGWQFTSRTLTALWMDGDPAVLGMAA